MPCCGRPPATRRSGRSSSCSIRTSASCRTARSRPRSPPALVMRAFERHAGARWNARVPPSSRPDRLHSGGCEALLSFWGEPFLAARRPGGTCRASCSTYASTPNADPPALLELPQGLRRPLSFRHAVKGMESGAVSQDKRSRSAKRIRLMAAKRSSLSNKPRCSS